MPQQRRGGHDDVRAHEQVLDDLGIRLDTAAGPERTREAARQECDPDERERQLGGRGQGKRSRHAKREEVDVRRVEAVEEHQAVRAGPHQFRRHVPRRREVRRQLDGDRNADARPDAADDVHVPPLHLGTADREIDRDRVDVELDRRGTRLLETARVLDPSFGRRAVQARDHRNVEGLRRPAERLEMPRHAAVVVRELGKIACSPRAGIPTRAPCTTRRPCPPRGSAPRRATPSPPRPRRHPRAVACRRAWR